jgi:radical SAM-linked protein
VEFAVETQGRDKLRLLFEKTGRARYISHLDLMRTLRRVFARAGVALRHTEGFNPHPRISLAMPLPVGQESVCEIMDFETEEPARLSAIPGAVNAKTPEGITAIHAYAAERPVSEIKWIQARMIFEYDDDPGQGAVDAMTEYFNSPSIVVAKRTKRGEQQLDIIPAIRSVEFARADGGRVDVRAVLSASEPVLNPDTVVAALSRDMPELAPDYVRIRREEIYDSHMNVFR